VDAHGGICKSGTWCVEGRQQRVHLFIVACGDLNTSSMVFKITSANTAGYGSTVMVSYF
jgi:hypothetical protein